MRNLAKPTFYYNINIQRIAQNLHPILPTHNQGAIQRALSDPTQVAHFVRERKAKIDYKALHLGHQIQQAAQEVKQKCKQMKKSVRKSAKATVTKLAPGAFSPKPVSYTHLTLPTNREV